MSELAPPVGKWVKLFRPLQKNWAHIVVIIAAMIYLQVSPEIFGKYVAKNGKPENLNITLPVESQYIKYNIENDGETIILDSQSGYQLDGWAFIENKPDQSQFEKFIVLNSGVRTYFFHYETTLRADVDKHFKDLGLNLQNAGFWVFMAPEAIKPDIYNIGILFANESSNEVYYTYTDRYLTRTPNKVFIERKARPENLNGLMP